MTGLVASRSTAPKATDTEDDHGHVPSEQNRGQLGGETGPQATGIGKLVDSLFGPNMPMGDDSEVVTLSAIGNKKATSDETWLESGGHGGRTRNR